MANSAFYQHYHLKDRYVQKSYGWNKQQFIDKGYISQDNQISKKLFIQFYVGDYDSAAWLYSSFFDKFNDSERGKVPLGWAINPNLSKRFPIIFDYLYENQSEMDLFTTGDSGAGYVTPTQILAGRVSKLPSGKQVWQEHNKYFYKRFNLKYTGFLIQGMGGKITDEAEQMYIDFSYEGGVLQTGYQPEGKNDVHMQKNTPFMSETDLDGCNLESSLQRVLNERKSGQTQFKAFRGVLCPASFYKNMNLKQFIVSINQFMTFYHYQLHIMDKLPDDIVVLTPINNAYLARSWLGGNNDNRISYIADNLGDKIFKINQSFNFVGKIRNEGWNDLVKIQMKIVFIDKSGQIIQTYLFPCQEIASSQIGECSRNINFPKSAGVYKMEYTLVDEKGNSFSEYGNIPWDWYIEIQDTQQQIQ